MHILLKIKCQVCFTKCLNIFIHPQSGAEGREAKLRGEFHMHTNRSICLILFNFMHVCTITESRNIYVANYLQRLSSPLECVSIYVYISVYLHNEFMKWKMRMLIQAHVRKSCGWKKGSKKTQMRRNQCPAEVRTLQNVFKAQEDEKTQPNKDIFSLLCGQSRKSPIVVQKSAQLREAFN